MTKQAKVVASKSDIQSRVYDGFEHGCIYCANKKPSIFNPENYPQKMHVAEMAYHSAQGTLYVRETTAEVEEQPGDDYVPPLEKNKPHREEPEIIAQEPILPHNFKGLKQVCSGITFMSEKEERDRDTIYNERLKKKLAERKLWKAFLKHIESFKKLDQMKTHPPVWVQELSVEQIAQLEKLPLILKQDTDEKSITYTRKFLDDIGVFPLPEYKVIQKAIEDCELDPLYFLTRMQKEVGSLDAKKSSPAKEITDFQMKKRTYTVSERILLSSIAHLHMPILIFKLHLILPPPAPDKLGKDFNIFEPLPEPDSLPSPKKGWFKLDADIMDDIFDNTLEEVQSIRFDDSKTTLIKEVQDSPSGFTVSSGVAPIRERKSKYMNIEDKTKELKLSLNTQQTVSSTSVHKKADDGKVFAGEEEVTQYPSFQSFFQEAEMSESNNLIIESFTQTNVSFHDNNVVLTQIHKTKEYDAETEKIEQEISDTIMLTKENKSEKVITKTEGVQTEAYWLPVNAAQDIVQMLGEDYSQEVMRRGTVDRIPGRKDFGELEDKIVDLIASIIKRPTEYEVMRKQMLKECLEKYNVDGLYDVFGIKRPQKEFAKTSKMHLKSNKKQKKEIKQNKLLQNVTSEKKSNFIEDTNEKLNADLDKLISKIRKEVAEQPIDMQLKFALKILALAGDPLANYPNLQSHPVLLRWFELRRGLKRKLSEKEKQKLMTKSKNIWGSLMNTTRDIRVPKITKNLTPKDLAQFTWDRRLWVKNKANKVREQFQHEIRQALVDDARALYPSMFTQYYNSKLNKNLRGVFFTYLPAKENDYYVFKPWRPSESRSKKE